MPAPLVPIALAAGVIRMAAPTVARALIKSGVAKEATKTALKNAGKNIPRVTKKQAENLANKRAGRTPSKDKPNTSTSPTSAPKPKSTGVGQQTPRRTGNRGAGRKPTKEKTPNTSTSPTSAPKPKNTGVGQQTPRPTGNRGAGRKPPRQNKQEQQSKQNKQEKPTPPSKPKISDAGKGAIALTAAATGVGGLASLNKKKEQDKKLKPVPEVNVRTLPKPKKVRPAPKKGDNQELNVNPKRQKPSDDDGYRFYGKKGTGLGDFSRKYGMKYATQEQFEKDFDMSGGAKKGGSIKKLAKKKRKGFSGRGAGKALRGF